MTPRYSNQSQTAKRLGISQATLSRLTKEGGISGVVIREGHRPLYEQWAEVVPSPVNQPKPRLQAIAIERVVKRQRRQNAIPRMKSTVGAMSSATK